MYNLTTMESIQCEQKIKMQAVCAELIQLKKTTKAYYKNQSKEDWEKVQEYRNTTDQRVSEAQARRKEKKAIQDGLRELADVTFHYWDTRNPPSNEMEYEASMEMPYSQKRWLHR